MDKERLKRIAIGLSGMDKQKQFAYLSALGVYNRLSDESYIKKKYRLYMGNELNLGNPVCFNEKMQWLKLYHHDEAYMTMVDKYEVKNYVARRAGEEYIIPTLGVWDGVDEIDFDKLPEKFVLKCTHDAGSVILCTDKKAFDFAAAKAKLRKGLKRNFYYLNREWAYRGVKPRIIAEKYIAGGETGDLRDYKIYNFHGKARAIQVSIDRFTRHKLYFYDTDWRYLGTKLESPADPGYMVERPEKLEEMLLLAERLSEGIPFVRTDFYCTNGSIYFGEFTFYPAGGYGKFVPEQLDYKFGGWINIL